MFQPVVTVRLSGPILDGQAADAVRGFLDDATREVGRVGADDVGLQLIRVLKNPTGFYESNIRWERAQDDMVVHDNKVVYGPWLEGVSSRNQTTRFRGYHTFRLVAQALRRKAPQIAERVLRRYMGRLG